MADTRMTALITGASAGLGLEYARLFARDGHDLVLIARRKEKLEELGAELAKAHGIKATVIAADLTKHDAPQKIFDEVAAAGIAVDFLVNNAGFGSSGPFVTSDLGRELDMIDVNVRALLTLARLFLPAMVERKRGRILNIASTAGFLAGPFMATYYATKAFVVSFTEALAYELRGTGVTATASCPGATATEFAAVSGTDKSSLFKSGVADAASVALHGYRAMLAGKTVAVPGFMNKLNIQMLRLSPRKMGHGIAAKLNRTPAMVKVS